MNQLCIDTLRQAALLDRLGARAGSGCAYRQGDRRCAIGALLDGFTTIHEHRRENTIGVEDLCNQHVGMESYLRNTFRLTIDAARELQKQHDELALRGAGPADFLAWIDGLQQQHAPLN